MSATRALYTQLRNPKSELLILEDLDAVAQES